MSDLNTLLASVEKAEGPSRELGDAVLSALISVHASDAARWYGSGECLTESLNEVLSLAERVLPGTWIEGALSSPSWIEIHNNDVLQPVAGARGATPALAILAAIIRAKIAQKEDAHV